MSLNDYASNLGGNTIKVNCYNLPDKVFLDANKTKNVIKFSVTPTRDRKEMQAGSPDIKVTELTGRTRMITRKELVTNYVLINGSKIKPYILKNGKEYIAYSRANARYKVFKIPENMMGEVNGQVVPSGNYVVYEVDQNGAIDRKSLAIVSAKNFRKMFKVPNQRVLQAHKLDTPRRGFSVFKRYQTPENRSKLMDSSANMLPASPMQNQSVQQQSAPRIPTRAVQQINVQSQQNMQPNKFIPNQVGGKFVPNQSRQFSTGSMGPNRNNQQVQIQAQALNKQPMQQNNRNTRFAMINRVFSLNGQLVGYTILDKASGKINKLDENQVMRLAETGNLENISLVTNNAGKRYLRGHGIVIDQLPRVIE